MDSIVDTLLLGETNHRALVFMTSVNGVSTAERILSLGLPETIVKSATSEHTEQANNHALTLLLGQGTENRLVACTSIFTQGVDFKDITHVFCVGGHSFLSLVQQFSRAGRGGMKGGKVVYFHRPQATQSVNKTFNAYLG